MACSPFSDREDVYLGLEPLRELPADFYVNLWSPDLAKSKERLSGSSYPCEHPAGSHHPDIGLETSPFSPQRIWALWILLLKCLLLPSALQICLRNPLWKGNKDLQSSRLLPLFLPSPTLLCTGSKKKAHRKIFFDQEQHHIVTLVLLHSIFQKEPVYRGGKFYNDCRQEFSIIRTYDPQGLFVVDCERCLICPATEEAQWLTVWGITMIFARSTSHKGEHLV